MNEKPLPMTVGELRALVGRAWGVDPLLVGITVGPRSIDAWAATGEQLTEVQIFVSHRVGPYYDDEVDPARVIVEAAERRIAEDLVVRRRVVETAEASLESARARLAATERLLEDVRATLRGGAS